MEITIDKLTYDLAQAEIHDLRLLLDIIKNNLHLLENEKQTNDEFIVRLKKSLELQEKNEKKYIRMVTNGN